jgi:hypothetical protein
MRQTASLMVDGINQSVILVRIFNKDTTHVRRQTVCNPYVATAAFPAFPTFPRESSARCSDDNPEDCPPLSTRPSALGPLPSVAAARLRSRNPCAPTSRKETATIHSHQPPHTATRSEVSPPRPPRPPRSAAVRGGLHRPRTTSRQLFHQIRTYSLRKQISKRLKNFRCLSLLL